jgi:hypothetical protein
VAARAVTKETFERVVLDSEQPVACPRSRAAPRRRIGSGRA